MAEACTICGYVGVNEKYVVKEMMLGTRHEFQYNRCVRCGCLQIGPAPPNLGEYYPKDRYYSFGLNTSLIGDKICKVSFRHTGPLYKILSYFFLTDPNLEAIGKTRIPKTARILDVGCGSGSTLVRLKSFGYNNLMGIDPYIDHELQEPVKVLKDDLAKLNPTYRYDLIMFLHSFEHVPNPLETLLSARDHLDFHGSILLRTPIVSYAFQRYGEYWYQIDAPRHFFVYSEYGLQEIINRAGLETVSSYYDSTDTQFTLSEAYKNNLSLNERRVQTTLLDRLARKIFSFDLRKAKDLNRHRRGDQAVFYIQKKQS